MTLIEEINSLTDTNVRNECLALCDKMERGEDVLGCLCRIGWLLQGERHEMNLSR